MNNIKTISVIIPVYNALDYVKKLFDSLLKNFDFNTGEIIIINDCSDDTTTKYLEDFAEAHSCFQLFKNSNNLGFVKSCNLGLKKAKKDILVLLNSDTEIPSNFNKKIIDCFNSDAKIGVASPIGSSSLEYNIPFFKGYSIDQMNELLNKKHKTIYPTILSGEGFCFCIRKEVIKQQGFFDEVYGLGYHEERDFAFRSISFGWRNVLIDNLYISHKSCGSFNSQQREKLIKQNDKIFQTRWKRITEKYIEDNLLINPIHKIKNEMLPIFSPKRILNFIYTQEKAGKLRRIKIFGKVVFSYRKKVS